MQLDCPACGKELQQLRRGDVKYWRCNCAGHLIAISSLRRMLPDGMWGAVWPTLRAAVRKGTRGCPGCGRWMETTEAADSFAGRPVDVCDSCRMIWFDPGELEGTPLRKVPPERPLEQRQAIGRAMAAAMQLEYDARTDSTVAPILSLLEELAKRGARL
ncbi:MAG: TFIIB-type zinc ribbon-containing protein [Planctomycetota bacterium]|jgi:Zn-finger nucleic acid-binding protein